MRRSSEAHPMQTEVVTAADAGRRLDRWLAGVVPGATRRAVMRLVARGEVSVNDRIGRKGQQLAIGDRVRFPVGGLGVTAAPDVTLSLSVVREDPHLVIIDKPAGVPSHPLRPGELGTAASALLARYPEMAGVGHHPREPGLLHRLDTDTSGLLMAARDSETFARLREALHGGRIAKHYEALVAGSLVAGAQYKAWLVARGARVRVFGQPRAAARPVRTEVVASAPCGDHCHVDVRVHVARRHQVRAHLAFIGHTLYGDVLYGGQAAEDGGGHCLHASALCFVHPMTGEQLRVTAPPPAAFRDRMARLARASPAP